MTMVDMGRGGGRRRLLVLVAGQAALAACVLVLVVVWQTKDLGTAANAGQLVGAALAVPALAVGLFAWWRRSRTPTLATPETLTSATGALRLLVGRQWDQEAKIRSLNDPAPIPVHWHLTIRPDLMDTAAGRARTPPVRWEGTSDHIAGLLEQFRGLPRRRLVLLGEAGSGKTTLAVQLVRELIRTRTEGEPVPVLVSAAGWDPATQPSVWEWMAGQLILVYPALGSADFGSDAAHDLVAGPDPMVLPVIDGLDEIPTPRGAAILRALNQTLGSGQLILTCRTKEYAAATKAADDVLAAAAVIEPAPLTGQAAAAFLTSCLRGRTPSPAWRHLLHHLATAPTGPATPPLAQVCATPLGLWLVRMVYRPSTGSTPAPTPDPVTDPTPAPDPTPLTDRALYPSAASLRAHLFNQLIPALIHARPPSDNPADLFRPRHLYDPADMAGWLRFLAHHLETSGTPDLAWWRLHTLVPLREIRIAAGIAAGLACGLAAAAGLQTAWGTGSALVILGGLLGGLLVRLSKGFEAEPAYATLQLRGRGLRQFAYAFVLALRLTLVVGIVIGLAAAVILGPSQGLVIGPAYAILTGVAFTLTDWVKLRSATDGAATPASTLHRDLVMTCIQAAAVGLTAGAAAGIILGPVAGLLIGCAFAFLGGIGTALKIPNPLLPKLFLPYGFSGTGTAGAAYLVSAAYLRAARRMPWRLMRFLDDAHRLGLLRTIGPDYQFRHAALQEHLADQSHTP